MKEKKRNKLLEKQPFKGKTAVVCGASEGIGKAIAKFFVELGASVSIIARRVDVLGEAKKDIEEQKNHNLLKLSLVILQIWTN